MTNSRKNNGFDVLIIGGGPAGLSALLWCNDLKMDALLLESGNELGGQLLHIYNPITNYPGRFAQNGREMTRHFLASVGDISKNVRLNSRVVSFDASSIAATLESGEVIKARSAIIATGVRRRKLGIPGEQEFVGRGILESGARDRETVKGKRVAIIGGGDAALENALILSEYAEKIYLIHRRNEFSARNEFISQTKAKNNIETLTDTIATSINGDDGMRSISIVDRIGARQAEIEIDALLIRIGVEPRSELFRCSGAIDESGYLTVNHVCQTSSSCVYAVGDVANPVAPTISTAAGTGALAIKTFHSFHADQVASFIPSKFPKF